jgi:hypothetical protein
MSLNRSKSKFEHIIYIAMSIKLIGFAVTKDVSETGITVRNSNFYYGIVRVSVTGVT